VSRERPPDYSGSSSWVSQGVGEVLYDGRDETGMTSSLQTIASACEAAGETIKGARFVARAIPLDMHRAVAEAAQAVALATRDHDAAVHHGWAYRVGPEHADFRWSDDGEPIGCAGQSILRRIDALGVLNVVVVVSRWGGSQRLSTGDLAKGYSEAARRVLATAEITAFVPMTVVAVTFDYADSGAVQGVLAAFRATHEHSAYEASVRLVVRVESSRIDALLAALRDATSARAQAEVVR
jgi:putative IMPACT (imprinted ancient) family translation regulator